MPAYRRIIVAVLALVVFLAQGCEPPPSDSQEANKQVIRDLYAALDAQDYDRINALASPDALLHIVGTDESMPFSSVMSEMVPMYYEAFQGYRHVVDQLVAEGDWVVARVTFHGTHTGEFQGVSPTGNEFTYGGVHIVRVVDGKVQENWMLEDDLRLMQQLGMELTPATSGS